MANILLCIGRFLFALVLLTSIHSKILSRDAILTHYLKYYEYVQVSLRSFEILIPRSSEALEIVQYFYYLSMILEGASALFILLGKPLAGYLLIVYYGVEAIIDYLIIKVGKGRDLSNIFVKWEFARYIALFGIAILLTYSLKKPFQK